MAHLNSRPRLALISNAYPRSRITSPVRQDQDIRDRDLRRDLRLDRVDQDQDRDKDRGRDRDQGQGLGCISHLLIILRMGDHHPSLHAGTNRSRAKTKKEKKERKKQNKKCIIIIIITSVCHAPVSPTA